MSRGVRKRRAGTAQQPRGFSRPQRPETTLSLLKAIILAYPRHSLIAMVCLIAGGMAEGLGIASLLPLLNLTVARETSSDNPISRAIGSLLGFMGLDPSIGALLLLIVIVMSLKGVLILVVFKQVGYTAAHVATDLRLALIRGSMQARWEHFISQPTGSLTNAIGTEAMRASNAYIAACKIMAGAIQVLVYTVIAFMFSWKATLAAIGAGVLMIASLNRLVYISRRAGSAQTVLLKSIAKRLTDALQGMKTLKSMACEDRLEPLLARATDDLKKARQKAVISQEGLRALQEPFAVVIIAVGLFFALKWWQRDLGELMLLVFIFWRTIQRFGTTQTLYQKVAIAESAYWSIRHAIVKAEGAVEITAGCHPPKLRREITFDGVGFAYNGKKVLEDCSFRIPANRFTAIIGPSGAGKTTLTDLAIGLLSPQRGEIRIDGVRLVDVDLKQWRTMIGYVPQETTLFHDTLLLNVTLGDDRLGRLEVQEALQLSGLGEYMVFLEQGVDTVVGERGAKMSGGQRQRLAIARALIRKPRLLILDEATTALDPETEAGICSTLKKLSNQMTIVAISHQPVLQASAHQVLFLNRGRVEQVRSK